MPANVSSETHDDDDATTRLRRTVELLELRAWRRPELRVIRTERD